MSEEIATAGTEPAVATLAEIERQTIEERFTIFKGNREQIAKSLGIGLRTLSGKLREYGYPPRANPKPVVISPRSKAPKFTETYELSPAAKDLPFWLTMWYAALMIEPDELSIEIMAARGVIIRRSGVAE